MMDYNKNEIITLDDSREFKIVEVVNINDILYLYLKSLEIDKYTIVKVIEDKIYNLTNNELSLVIANMFKYRWSY